MMIIMVMTMGDDDDVSLGSCHAALSPSSIPQGSVLGPILIAIYVNDLPSITINKSSAFMRSNNLK